MLHSPFSQMIYGVIWMKVTKELKLDVLQEQKVVLGFTWHG